MELRDFKPYLAERPLEEGKRVMRLTPFNPVEDFLVALGGGGVALGILRSSADLCPSFRWDCSRRRLARGRRRNRRRFALTQRPAMKRRRQWHGRFDSVGRCDRQYRRGGDQRQHSAGKQAIDRNFAHITHSTYSTTPERIKLFVRL